MSDTMYEFIESLANVAAFSLAAWNAGFNFYINPDDFNKYIETYAITKE